MIRIFTLSGDVVQLTVGHWQNWLLLLLISQIPLVAARAAAVTRTWMRADGENFRSYTTGTAGQVAPLLERLELARAFFLESGISASPTNGKPLRIIAFADARDYFEYQPKAGAAAFFQPGREADYILLQGLGAQYERIVTHEYVHYVFRQSYPGLPLWLQEGLADLYSSLELRNEAGGQFFSIGELLPERRWDPADVENPDLKTLFSAGYDSASYEDGSAGWHFYAESWALAHLLAVGPEYSPKLPQFLAALSAGAPARQAFASVYRKDLAQIEADLRSHWAQTSVPAATIKRRTSYTPVLSAIRIEAEPNPLTVELFLANVLAASPEKQKEAEAKLTALESQYPATPEVEESLAYLLLRQKRTPEAQEHMRAAVRCGSRNADLLVRYASIAEQGGAKAEEVLPLLEQALELDPDNDGIRLRVAQRAAKTGSFGRAISLLMDLRSSTMKESYVFSYTLAYCQAKMGNLKLGAEYALQAAAKARSGEERTSASALVRYVQKRAETMTEAAGEF